MLRKFLLASAAAVACSTGAFAADLPSRAPPPVYVPPAPFSPGPASISAVRSVMAGVRTTSASPIISATICRPATPPAASSAAPMSGITCRSRSSSSVSKAMSTAPASARISTRRFRSAQASPASACLMRRLAATSTSPSSITSKARSAAASATPGTASSFMPPAASPSAASAAPSPAISPAALPLPPTAKAGSSAPHSIPSAAPPAARPRSRLDGRRRSRIRRHQQLVGPRRVSLHRFRTYHDFRQLLRHPIPRRGRRIPQPPLHREPGPGRI